MYIYDIVIYDELSNRHNSLDFLIKEFIIRKNKYQVRLVVQNSWFFNYSF